jgi:replicative DNA helicase
MAKIDLDFFEKIIIQHCLKKDSTYIASIIDYLDKSLFKDSNIAEIIDIIKTFYIERNSIPTLTELKSRVNTLTLKECLKKIVGYVRELDSEYNENELVHNTEYFIKQRKYALLMEKAIDEKASKKEFNLEEIQKESEKIHQITLIDNFGLDYFGDNERVVDYLQQKDSFISTGYRTLDEAFGGGFQKEGKAIYDIGGETNVGKAQPNSLVIYTPNGYKKFGELKVGDMVYGKSGTPVKITHIHPRGVKKVYRVIFGDGRETFCCPEHLWTVWNSCKQRYQTLDTETIKYKIENFSTYKNRLQVPLCEPVQFHTANDSEIIIHPYLVGALLGDGGLSVKNKQSFTNFDNECNKRFLCELEKIGLKLSGTRTTDITKIKGTKKNIITEEFKKMNLEGTKSDSKFIPEKYIFTSIENRFSLLEGFLDTDGHVSKGSSLEIVLKNERMINQLAFIVYSLGGNGKVTKCYKKYKDEIKEYFRLRIRFPYNVRKKLNIISRKKERLLSFGDNRKCLVHNNIKCIETYKEEECTCITVDADDHLYLTNDFIVTHNSIYLGNIALNVVLQNKNVVIISPEMSEMRYAKRISGMLTGVAVNLLGDNIEKYKRDIEEFKKKYSSKFIIKEVPTKGVSAKNIYAYLKKLKDKKGINPDLLCIDGHALLKPSVSQNSKHAELQFIVQECRGISYQIEAPILTVAQLNRGSHKANNPGLDNMAGSWDQLADFDAHVNIWQTDEDREASIIRFGGKKVRDGAKGGEGYLRIDYDTLRLFEEGDAPENFEPIGKETTLSSILDFDSLMKQD